MSCVLGGSRPHSHPSPATDPPHRTTDIRRTKNELSAANCARVPWCSRFLRRPWAWLVRPPPEILRLIPEHASAMDDLRCWTNAWAHHRGAADGEGLIRPAPLPVGGGMVGAHPRITGTDPDARVLKP